MLMTWKLPFPTLEEIHHLARHVLIYPHKTEKCVPKLCNEVEGGQWIPQVS